MTLYDSITETIGETPLVRLNRMCPPGTHVYVKIEKGNPAGSIKDRAALSMIEDAVARGALKEGGTIIEPTSGNTGIAIAMIAAARGYKAVIVMPDTMSRERISLMRAYGAEVVLSPGAEGMAGAVRMAESIREATVALNRYIFRYGGDEFLLMVEEAGMLDTDAVVQRIRENFRRLMDRANADFSVGVVRYDISMRKDIMARLNEADARMYYDKRGEHRKGMSTPPHRK